MECVKILNYDFDKFLIKQQDFLVILIIKLLWQLQFVINAVTVMCLKFKLSPICENVIKFLE